MNCNHHWTVTSPCPDCLQDELRREMVSNAELNDKIAKLRGAIAKWPEAHHQMCRRFSTGCCTCGADKVNVARAEARKLAGLEVEP